MGIVLLLIQVTCRNEEVKRCLERLLWIAEQRMPAVPARRTERTWRVYQTSERHGDILVLGMTEPLLIHRILVGMILALTLATNLGGEAGNALQVRFHIGLPFSLVFRRAVRRG